MRVPTINVARRKHRSLNIHGPAPPRAAQKVLQAGGPTEVQLGLRLPPAIMAESAAIAITIAIVLPPVKYAAYRKLIAKFGTPHPGEISHPPWIFLHFLSDCENVVMLRGVRGVCGGPRHKSVGRAT